MFKRAAVLLFLVTIVGGAWYGVDVIDARSYELTVIGAAPMYSLPPHEYPKSNPIAATLQPGQAVRVLRHRYGKDFQAFRVETLDGRVGWVVGGEGIEVRHRG